MEEVINLLYDIEEKATQIVNRANEEKVSLHDALEKNMELLDQTIATENATKLSILQAKVDLELTREKQALIEDCNKQLVNLEAHYKKDHDALVNEIFQGLIKA